MCDLHHPCIAILRRKTTEHQRRAGADPRYIQVEAGIGYVKDSDCDHYDFPLSVTYGVTPGLEAGIALEIQIHPKAQWVGEVFAQDELTSDADTVVQYNTGFRVDAVENVTVDIAGGSGISGDAPDFTATLGLTWVFGG
jgi:hypothetical protein